MKEEIINDESKTEFIGNGSWNVKVEEKYPGGIGTKIITVTVGGGVPTSFSKNGWKRIMEMIEEVDNTPSPNLDTI